MRASFVKALLALAERDERVLLLTGDLGFMVFEPFMERFPGRFFNAGVAEQNMVGMATGLAEAGFVPFVYSIVPFAALRPLEFLRNGPVLHRLPVRLVGMGAGFDYGHNGYTHFGIDDVAAVRSLPGLLVLSPAEARQVPSVLSASASWPGPVYYRLGKDDRAEVPGLDGRFDPGGVDVVREGSEILLLATGSVAAEAALAGERLASEGSSPTVGVVTRLAPTPVDALAALLARHTFVVTVEAHFLAGGLGSLVAEVIAERGLPCRLVRRGVDEIPASAGTPHLLARFGLDRESLAATCRALRGAP